MSTATMSPVTVDTLHLARIQAENWLKVKAVDIQLAGKSLALHGPNGSGKTSILDLVWVGLGGKASKDLPEPIRLGESKATSRLELAGPDGQIRFIIERRWSEKSTSLVITAGDGSQVKRPQDLLNQLFDQHTLDPAAFLRKRPAEQVEDLLRICGVTPPVEQVAGILGEEIAARDGEPASAYLDRITEEDGLLYVRRRALTRILDQKRAASEEARKRLAAAGKDDAAGETPIADLLKRRASLQQARDRLQTERQVLNDGQNKREAARNKLQGLHNDAQRLGEEKARLLARVQQIDTETAQLLSRINKGEEIIEALTCEIQAQEAIVAKISDPAKEIAELDQQLANQQQASNQAAERRQAKETAERLDSEAEQAETEVKKINLAIRRIRDLRATLLQGVELPVKGLEVGNGELRFNGASFRQASHAEQLRVSCALACKRNPRIKILRLDDAEHLDNYSRQMLLEVAKEHGFQCLLAFVSDSPGLKVEVVEA